MDNKLKSDEHKYYCVITPYFPSPEHWNGSFVYDHVCAVQRNGYKTIVINVLYRGNDYAYGGVCVWPTSFQTQMSMLFGWWQDFRNYKTFKRCLENHGVSLEDIDILLCVNVENGAGVLRVIKQHYPTMTVLTQTQDPDPYGCNKISNRCNAFGLKRFLTYCRNRKLMESMDAIVSISDNVSKVIREFPHQTIHNTFAPAIAAMHDLRFCKTAKPKKIIRLHNGVDRSIFYPKLRNRTKLRFEMGMIGHLWSHWFKDPMTLVYALGKIKDKLGDWRMTFIGTGDCIEKAKMFAKEHGFEERLRFLPNMDHKQLPDFYRGLDLFVMPSYWEGFGCVFTEAYASGVPFITCEGQGMDDLIRPEDRCLWLCKIQDPDDLAEKILYYYENRPKQILAAEIDIDKLVPKYLDELEKMRRA